ncbi:MAG: hypothetical protein M0R80_07680 [Proteobacteria bacterium]|jgi:hypothetical protein|nr:hypothetical protein [Pseudomonadota bacterium]
MRYLCLFRWGRHEDQEIACVPVVLDLPAIFTPLGIVKKLTDDLHVAYKEEAPIYLACPNEKCKAFDNSTTKHYCSECGSENIVIPDDNDEEFHQWIYEQLFRAVCDGFSPAVEQALQTNGWELFPKNYHPDKIATISGVADYLEGNWYDEFGEIE